MMINFKLGLLVLFLIASCSLAVAQTETYKDVLLDGKPAKLNIKTGEVIFSDGTIAKSLAARKIKDSVTVSNTIIKKNPILIKSKRDKNTTNLKQKSTQTDIDITTKSDSTNVIYTNRPDTLINYYKNKKFSVATDSVMTTQTVFIATKTGNIDTLKTKGTTKMSHSELLKTKEKVTSMIYEVSQPTTYYDNNANYHTVLKGETLYALSQRYRTSLGALKKANNLETTLITIGQILRIRNFESSSSEQNLDLWTVSKGDTLYNIAKRNNTTVASIKSLNGLESNLIKIGQKLQLK